MHSFRKVRDSEGKTMQAKCCSIDQFDLQYRLAVLISLADFDI